MAGISIVAPNPTFPTVDPLEFVISKEAPETVTPVGAIIAGLSITFAT